ncbi:MAG: hypothetical protein QHH10_10965 [Peptococcaceae bacterium]|jgi:tight adherence protein B|nr:hypothetical protein [Peptococcaceae bacterium]MDH7525820.1 hypothetical protein [Peptococcaceae bacterium]
MNGLGLLVCLGWAVGVFLIVYTAGLSFLKKMRFRLVFQKDKKTQKHLLLAGNPRVKRWKAYIEEHAGLAGLNWSFNRFMLYSLAACITGSYLAGKYLHNIYVVIPLGFGFSLLPGILLDFFINRKQRLLEKQLIAAVQHFISEYGTLPNIVSSLNNILPVIDYPLFEELDRLIRELNSGRSSEAALFSFAARINSRWAYRFAHILNLRINRGVDINAMLFNLYMDMKTRLVKEKERGMETIGVRMESYLMYLFIPVMYAFSAKINPEAHYLMTRTAGGRLMMFAAALLLVAGIFFNLRLGSSRIK